MSWKTDVIEALATIKADTTNHNGELQEFKRTFIVHVEKEEGQQEKTDNIINEIKGELQTLGCPYSERIETLEESDKINLVDISSLKTARKYNYLSIGGLYTISGVILKKIFM